MTIDVVNAENKKVGAVELKDEVFGGRVKTDLIHESVVRLNAAERRGTHTTKNRANVSGSGKKPWRQKGTGRARVGEIRNPLWRGGGTVFGPQPRSYEYQMPKKVEKGALRAALMEKLQAGSVIVVDALTASEVKTKAAAGVLKTIGVTGKALLIDAQLDEKFAMSVRNLAGVTLVQSNRVTARDVANTKQVVLTRPRSKSWRRRSARNHETDRSHPPAAGHREDHDAARRRQDHRVRSGEGRQQDRHPARHREAARRQGGGSSHLHHARQAEAPGPFRRPPLRLEEGVRHAARGRKDA